MKGRAADTLRDRKRARSPCLTTRSTSPVPFSQQNLRGNALGHRPQWCVGQAPGPTGVTRDAAPSESSERPECQSLRVAAAAGAAGPPQLAWRLLAHELYAMSSRIGDVIEMIQEHLQ